MAWLIGGRLAMLAVAALVGCGPAADPAERLLGRWQRFSPTGLDEPIALMSEHLEFRPEGVLVSLLYDDGPAVFWTLRSDSYAVEGKDRIALTGQCLGPADWEPCRRAYWLTLGTGSLRLTDETDAGRWVEYRRIGELEPPMSAPPRPTGAQGG